MPTKLRRENTFIGRFLSAYENKSWTDAKLDWLDERMDGAVEVVATRKADGRTLAIEHTIIEPFENEKQDFAFFEKVFLKIEQDKALPVRDLWIRAFIPVGTLYGHSQNATQIAEIVHEWLRRNRLNLPTGFSEHSCPIEITGEKSHDLKLYFKVVRLAGPGTLHVRRQQMEDNLDAVIMKALKKKVPKLAQTPADKRILLIERQHDEPLS